MARKSTETKQNASEQTTTVSRKTGTRTSSVKSDESKAKRAAEPTAAARKTARRARRAASAAPVEVGILYRVRVSTICVATVVMLFCAAFWPSVLDFRAKLSGANLADDVADAALNGAAADTDAVPLDDVSRDEWRERLDALCPRGGFADAEDSDADAEPGVYGSLADASEAFEPLADPELRASRFNDFEPGDFAANAVLDDLDDSSSFDPLASHADNLAAAPAASREFPYAASSRVGRSAYAPAETAGRQTFAGDDNMDDLAENLTGDLDDGDLADDRGSDPLAADDSFNSLDVPAAAPADDVNPLLADLAPVDPDDPLGLGVSDASAALPAFDAPLPAAPGASLSPARPLAATEPVFDADPVADDYAPLPAAPTGGVSNARYDAPEFALSRPAADLIPGVAGNYAADSVQTAAPVADDDFYAADSVQTAAPAADDDLYAADSARTAAPAADNDLYAADDFPTAEAEDAPVAAGPETAGGAPAFPSVAEAALAPSYFSRAVGLFGGPNAFSALYFARAANLVADDDSWSPDALSRVAPIAMESEPTASADLLAALDNAAAASASAGVREPVRAAAVAEPDAVPTRSALPADETPVSEPVPAAPAESDDYFPEYPEPTLSAMHAMYPTLVGYVERTTIESPAPLAAARPAAEQVPAAALSASAAPAVKSRIPASTTIPAATSDAVVPATTAPAAANPAAPAGARYGFADYGGPVL